MIILIIQHLFQVFPISIIYKQQGVRCGVRYSKNNKRTMGMVS